MSNPWGIDADNQSRNIDDVWAEYNKRKPSKAIPEDYKCEYCEKKGTREAIKAHERKCKKNPSNRKPMAPEDFNKAYKAYVAENIRKARASFPAEPKSNASSRKVRTATGHAVTTVASGKGTSFSAPSPDKKKRNISVTSVTSDMPLKKILASMRKAKKKKKKKTQGNPQEGSGRRQRRTRRKKKRNSRRRRRKKRRRSRKYRRRTRR